MARIFMRFPGGKAKTLTLSYDDGVEQDIKLIEIMVQHGLKGTFNISSGRYAAEGTVYPEGTISRKMTKKVAQKVYLDHGMEVAVHGLTHPNLNKFPDNVCAYEVMQDRINLEEDFGTFVRGMAYPYGSYSDSVVEILKMCGIVYSRTVESTERFDIPTDWLRMPATCHHKNPRLMELARNFAENNTKLDPSLFYLWGHSYEFERDDATDDELLILYFRAACRKAENFINRKLYEETVPEGDPEGVLIADDVLLALMLLVGHWYENRENSSDVSKAPVPFGFSSLLEPYRFIPL